jgi:hypothetical protein
VRPSVILRPLPGFPTLYPAVPPSPQEIGCLSALANRSYAYNLARFHPSGRPWSAMRTSSLLQPRGAPRNIADSSAKHLNTISKGNVFNSPNLSGQIHRESCRVHFVRNMQPDKARARNAVEGQVARSFVFSCPSCFRCARHASGRRRVRGRFPRKPKEQMVGAIGFEPMTSTV